MRHLPVYVAQRSNRKPILKREELRTYFPTRADSVEPRIPEPGSTVNCTPPIDNIHWICWPEPAPAPTPPRRPQTSLGFHRTRPDDGDDGDVGTRDDIYVDNAGDMKLAGYVQPMNFDPDFNTWQNCSRKDGLQNMGVSQVSRSHTFHHEPTRCPMTSITANPPPSRDNYTAYNGPRPSYAGVNGYTQPPGPEYQTYGVGPMNDMRIEGHQALPSVFRSKFNKYPLLSRQPRYPALSDDYVHEYSMFMSTTPRVTGHFIIHPDWVSEKGGLRRSRSMIQHISKQKHGDALRY